MFLKDFVPAGEMHVSVKTLEFLSNSLGEFEEIEESVLITLQKRVLEKINFVADMKDEISPNILLGIAAGVCGCYLKKEE
jgi:hypothetical protein